MTTLWPDKCAHHTIRSRSDNDSIARCGCGWRRSVSGGGCVSTWLWLGVMTMALVRDAIRSYPIASDIGSWPRFDGVRYRIRAYPISVNFLFPDVTASQHGQPSDQADWRVTSRRRLWLAKIWPKAATCLVHLSIKLCHWANLASLN